MITMEPFTFIESVGSNSPLNLFDKNVQLTSAKTADHDLQYIAALRKGFPDLIVTACPANNVPLRAFAAAGFATCERDTQTDSFASLRGYSPPARRSESGSLAEYVSFAKWHYEWKGNDFILYTVGPVQYVLIERRGDEDILGPSKATDDLIRTVGNWINTIADVVWVYDNYWRQDRELWAQVQKASWDDVILDESVKQELTSVAHKFFDSEQTYRDLGVPWRRGLMFYGPPGNGKTVSIKALMHSLYNRKDPIPTLYVRDAPYTYDIGQVFSLARRQAPCMLVLEDVETIVTPDTRSYFFNEMDGLANNDGLFIVASTNFLDKLDPGLSKRPSRFDRKYCFPIPNEHERTLYCEFWRRKLKSNKSIDFPDKLCPAMAHVTPGFSFAYMQECFIATMLQLARDDEELQLGARPFDSDNDDLNDYPLWVAFKEQADILRRDLDDQRNKQSQLIDWCSRSNVSTENITAPDAYPQRRENSRSQTGLSTRAPSRLTSVTQNLQRMRVDDSLLPELPWSSQKQDYINPAAIEWRLP